MDDDWEYPHYLGNLQMDPAFPAQHPDPGFAPGVNFHGAPLHGGTAWRGRALLLNPFAGRKPFGLWTKETAHDHAKSMNSYEFDEFSLQ